MSKLTLTVLIDGLRHDYIDKMEPSFLSEVKRSGASATVKEVFGYQLRHALFAGLYPERSDIAHLYTFEPEESPFLETEIVPDSILQAVDQHPFNSPIRSVLDRLARRREARRGHDCSKHMVSSAQIPLELLDHFAVSEREPIWEPNTTDATTLFDLFDEYDIEYCWIAYPTNPQRTEEIEEAFFESLSTDHQFAFLHYAELDWTGHSAGPLSVETKHTLESIDKSTKNVFEYAREKFDEVELLVFGDHGMVPVWGTINIENKLSELDYRVQDDYMYFLDSNQARFEFFSTSAKKEINDMLDGLSHGSRLTDADLEDMNAKITDRYGDSIFLADPGFMISPNFFQNEGIVNGMHGYHPDTPANHSEAIMYSENSTDYHTHDGTKELVDIFPTILTMMDIPIPDSNQGESIIERKA